MEGFWQPGDGTIKGKGISSILGSKVGRSQLLAMFGGADLFPSSVMKAKRLRNSRETDEPTVDRSYDAMHPNESKYKDKRNCEMMRVAYRISGMGVSNGALSSFHQGIGRSMVLFYSDPGDTIFDPFAGHNSRMDLCVKAGRHYTGCDLSTEFMTFNQKRAIKLRSLHPQAQITLHHTDSRKVPVPSRSADFTITSPPYWDIEYYGDEPEQLGKCKTYENFLDSISLVMGENHRVLRSGAYAIWFINDFRKDGKFYLYHMDIVRLGESVGFIPHDLLVVDLERTMRGCFANQVVASRILPKRHEYGIVFRKPDKTKTKVNVKE